MVFDEIQAKFIEQVYLVIAVSIRSRWRRLNDTDGRCKYRRVLGRQYGRLEKPTVQQ